MAMKRRSPLSRRDLLAGAAAVSGAAALGGCRAPLDDPAPATATASASPAPATMRYRTLGRTGLRVSEIGVGGFPLDDPDVLLYAADRGINYVDTAHCYRGGASERAIGQALKTARDRFVVTTKWCPHHIGQPARKQVFLDMLDESLRRLQTDHVDVVLNHEVGRHSDGEGVERLRNEEMFAAFETAKQAGKVRFLGASGHDGDLMAVMDWAVSSGRFDVILCRYSFLDYPDQQTLIDRAAQKGVGVVAMKTLAGAKGADLDRFRDRQATFKQAALKWVLSNAKLSNLIISISSRRRWTSTSPPRAQRSPQPTTRRSPNTRRSSRTRSAASATPARPPARTTCESPTCCASRCTSTSTARSSAASLPMPTWWRPSAARTAPIAAATASRRAATTCRCGP